MWEPSPPCLTLQRRNSRHNTRTLPYELCWLGCHLFTDYSKPMAEGWGRSEGCCLNRLLQEVLKNICLSSEVSIGWLIDFPILAILGSSLCCLHALLIWLFSHFCSIFIFSLVVVLFVLNSEKCLLRHAKTVWSSSCCALSLYMNVMSLWAAGSQIEDVRHIFLYFSPSRIGTNHVKCFSDVSMNLR